MKLRILSDLHLEFSDFTIEYENEDILIVPGDICPNFEKSINLLKQYIDSNAKPVILVLGNHDFWYSSLEEIRKKWKINIKNLYVLDNNYIKINDILFIGSTLWTDANINQLKIISKALGDMKYISDLNGESWMFENKQSAEFIKLTCSNHPNEKIVVITHHLPSYKSIAEEYEGSPLNFGFANKNLDSFIENSNIKLWIHGHTHFNVDYKIGNTRIYCNPRGYVTKYNRENINFNPKNIITFE